MKSPWTPRSGAAPYTAPEPSGDDEALLLTRLAGPVQRDLVNRLLNRANKLKRRHGEFDLASFVMVVLVGSLAHCIARMGQVRGDTDGLLDVAVSSLKDQVRGRALDADECDCDNCRAVRARLAETRGSL